MKMKVDKKYIVSQEEKSGKCEKVSNNIFASCGQIIRNQLK